MHKCIISIILAALFTTSAFAQISPPGLGDANTCSWVAFGVRQKLDSADKTQSFTYIGMGRESNPSDYNLAKKPAIWVINQEFFRKLRKHWQYSVALSYRQQNEYSDTAPFEKENPGVKQEFRLYGRFAYTKQMNRFKFTTTFRQEFRKFYRQDFENWSEDEQLRSRFRQQISFNIDKNKVHRLLLNAEALCSISQENTGGQKEWTAFDYHESRFSFYYTYAPQTSPFLYSIGYMNNLLGKDSFIDVHYLAFDIIWENPFKKKKERFKNEIIDPL